jgi:hypothetical protein
MDTSPRPSPARWIIAGGLLVGTLDLLFASAFWAMRNVPPIRIAQSIAAGVLGDASYDGGAASAWLGVGLHYFIAMMFVLVYWLMARRAAALLHHPVRFCRLFALVMDLVLL